MFFIIFFGMPQFFLKAKGPNEPCALLRLQIKILQSFFAKGREKLRSSARHRRARSRARITSFPLVDPEATHRPYGFDCGLRPPPRMTRGEIHVAKIQNHCFAYAKRARSGLFSEGECLRASCSGLKRHQIGIKKAHKGSLP